MKKTPIEMAPPLKLPNITKAKTYPWQDPPTTWMEKPIERKIQSVKPAKNEPTSEPTSEKITRVGYQKLPQMESINFSNENQNKMFIGFSKWPHLLEHKLMKEEMSQSAFRVALCIMRFTLGFNRKTAPLSSSVIQRYTGIKSKNLVIKAVKELVSRGVITSETSHETQVRQITVTDQYLNHEVLEEDILEPISTQNEQGKESEPVHESAPVKAPEPVNESSPNIYINKYYKNNINTLSTEEFKNPVLQQYFSKGREISQGLTKRQLEEEYTFFKDLSTVHNEDTLAEALEHLEKKGGVGGKTEAQKIHYPFKYLASGGISPTLEKLKTGKVKKEKEETKNQETEKANDAVLKQKEKFEDGKRIFESKFPSPEQQKKVLKDIIDYQLPRGEKSLLKGDLEGLERAAKRYWITQNVK